MGYPRSALYCLAILLPQWSAVADNPPGTPRALRDVPEPRKMYGIGADAHTGPGAGTPWQVEKHPKPMSNPKIKQAAALMAGFVQRTGLDAAQEPRRYLWTDAFAVCNLLGLARHTGDPGYTRLALRLADQVHHTLGRHRADGPARGWLSGLGEHEGETHPTRGGLRIGKRLPERGMDQAFDHQLEWERDGQYFHYLTKWMHALDQLSRSTGQPRFRQWAGELAVTAHDAFSYQPADSPRPRMFWKMSIDLSRPLVSSMGQHDPLDGYVTAMQLGAAVGGLPHPDSRPQLERASRDFAAMLQVTELASADPLGIGGLLSDAYRVEQLIRLGAMPDDGLLERLLGAALTGLEVYAGSGELRAPARYRLAFRELGLAIGLEAAHRMHEGASQAHSTLSPRTRKRLEALQRYLSLGDDIESFWLRPENQRTDTWVEHRDINEVMLATRLVPDGFLVFAAPE